MEIETQQAAAGREAELVACPQCDQLHRQPPLRPGRRARCRRCGHVLFAPRRGAVPAVVGFAAAALVLMAVAISFPFLTIDASGLSSRASVLDAVMSFALASGLMAPLSLTVAALIILLPAARLGGIDGDQRAGRQGPARSIEGIGPDRIDQTGELVAEHQRLLRRERSSRRAAVAPGVQVGAADADAGDPQPRLAGAGLAGRVAGCDADLPGADQPGLHVFGAGHGGQSTASSDWRTTLAAAV